MFDIGKRDVLGHSILPLNSFDQARSFYTTDLLQVMQSNLEQGKGATPAYDPPAVVSLNVTFSFRLFPEPK